VLVTKSKDGALVVAAWNIVNPGSTGSPRTVKLQLKGIGTGVHASIQRVDEDHGNVLGLWQKLGSPRYPTQGQLESLRQNSQLGAPEGAQLTEGSLTVHLPVNGLAVIQIR
jgi:xylan 1,4-beta-xylosidase